MTEKHARKHSKCVGCRRKLYGARDGSDWLIVTRPVPEGGRAVIVGEPGCFIVVCPHCVPELEALGIVSSAYVSFQGALGSKAVNLT